MWTLNMCLHFWAKLKLGKLLIISKWWTILMLIEKCWKCERLNCVWLHQVLHTYLFSTAYYFHSQEYRCCLIVHSCLVVKSSKHDNLCMTTPLVAITINDRNWLHQLAGLVALWINDSLAPRLSLLKREKACTFYHMRDVKGRHKVGMTYLHVGTYKSPPKPFGARD